MLLTLKPHGSITANSRVPRKPIPGAPKREAWHPPDWEIPDAAALQALARGTATEEQQRRALQYVIENICGTYDMSFRSGRPDDSAFAEGKRFVGLQIVKLLKLNLGAIRGKPTEQG